MKKFLILCALSGFAIATNMHFEKNQKCSECHPTIYEEYKKSQHGKATVFEDPIHAAVYYKHPQYTKMDKYRCGACHVPTADNLSQLLAANNGIVPDKKNKTQNEAVACAYCHRIEDTTDGKAFRKNVISKEERVYFSNKSSPEQSPYHAIKSKKSIFKDGKLCMGCHARKSNPKAFDVCETDINQKAPIKNCIECHMHKVDGPPSVMSQAKQHTFHGFPGIHGDLTHLSQYIGMDISSHNNKMFTIKIDHNIPHASLLHPLRMGKLVVTVKRGSKVIKMHDRKLMKIIGDTDGASPAPTPPWLATQIIKDTRIPANTSKVYTYTLNMESGDVITAKFGYLLVKPKALKKFNLQDNKEAKKFRIIKEQSFTVK